MRKPSLVLLVCALFGGITLFAGAQGQPRQAGDGYTLTRRTSAPPEGVNEAIVDHIGDEVFTVLTPSGEPLMDLWFAKQLPAPDTRPVDPSVAYGTLPEGIVLAVMQLHAEHRDFRDQTVPAGTYLVRYLRQPDDGNHLGETTYRDFGVLTSSTGRSADAQRFDVTLAAALRLNTHPFTWGLWPAQHINPAEQPGIANFDDDKWAIKLSLPRQDGSTVSVAMVVVGNERHYY